MRYGFIAALAAFAVCLAPAVKADDAPKDVKGLFLMSDYPAVTLRPGETSTVSLRIQNYDMAPERLALSVSGVPTGWTATLLGGGQPVAAAMPATNSSVALSLRLDVPKDAAMGTQTLTVAAAGSATTLQLPIAVTLAKDLPAKLTVTPQLPELRGTAKFRRHLHRAVRQPGAQRSAGRCRPDQRREAQSHAAEYGRGRPL
jgi:hypothetical protein